MQQLFRDELFAKTCKMFNLPVSLFTKALISSTNVTNVDLNFLFEGEIIIRWQIVRFLRRMKWNNFGIAMKHMLQPIYSNTLARKFPPDQLRGTLTFLIVFRKARISSTNIRIRMKCSGIVLGLDLVSILTIETVWGFL